MQKLYSTAKEGLKGSVDCRGLQRAFTGQKSAFRGLEVILEAVSVLVEAIRVLQIKTMPFINHNVLF
jgi:hypothetical protein